MEEKFEIMCQSKTMDELRWNFLELTREIFTSKLSSEEKQNLRKESEDKFDEIKEKILKN